MLRLITGIVLSFSMIIPNLMFKQSFINDFKELLWEDINVNCNLKGKFDNFYEKVHTADIQMLLWKNLTRSN